MRIDELNRKVSHLIAAYEELLKVEESGLFELPLEKRLDENYVLRMTEKQFNIMPNDNKTTFRRNVKRDGEKYPLGLLIKRYLELYGI